MRLSRLHIAGFKSFPDRAELGFDQGVTAIVGPNGCGKSNVVDAITWVLGEQSARSLRGERMEDVIFNGSDARKPTATAEVRLQLTRVAQAATAIADQVDAESDGSPLVTRDIEIGRRLYRSGESEYLIDGEVRRLRDIHDLLMDSGLGVKAYAVIEQGKIGQILSSRPAERRTLIEEAAGVTKYKSRRRSAELKLEAAQQNLTRVDDIVFEIEKQRAALKRQAARARRYRRLREELRKWEQVQLVRRYERLAREIEAAGVRLDQARTREAGAASRVAELEAALEGVRLGLTEAEAGATAMREAAHQRQLEIGRRQQQIEFDGRQIEDLAAQAQAFDAEAAELEARREPSARVLDGQRAALARAREAHEEAGRQAADREGDYARAFAAVQAVERESDAARAAVLSAATTLSALAQARDHAAAARDRLAAERERFEIEVRELAAEAERARHAQEEANAALARVRDDHARVAATRAGAETALAARRADRETAQQARASRERDLAALEARLRSLQDLEASRATYGDAARLLLADPAYASRHHGAVADHLIVEHPFERAVDALLGDLLQHVVIDRAADVAAGLALLGERNAGRCGFMVVEESLEAARVGEPLVVPPGARALADVVRATGPYARAIERLVGTALIVDTFEDAARLSRTVQVPVASRAGEVFRESWLVQGGIRQDVHGILETRGEIATLRREVELAGREVETLVGDLALLDGQIRDGEAAVAAALAEQHAHEKAIVGHEAQAGRSGDERARVLRRLEVVETELAHAVEEVAASERRRDEAAAAIAEHQTGQDRAEAGLADILARLQGVRDESEAKMRLVAESRTSQAALVERVAALEADVARLEQDSRDLEERILGRRAHIHRTEVRREELRASIRESERLLDEDVRTLETLHVEMRSLDERVTAFRERFDQADRDIRTARSALDAARAELTASEVAQARAASDVEHLETSCIEAVGQPLVEVRALVARLEEAGELAAPAAGLTAGGSDDEGEDGEADETPAAVEAAGGTAADPEAIITSLRQKIDRLGPVNMMAIEQFDDLESRHAFLTTQRQDLLDSIAQTGEAIRKIDKTTRERFSEAFESINRHFEHTFTTLFGGGRAGLVLIDQENEVESGIDIIAQPPGKRLQNVQLLSGGEKALTAMALMFAVFRYRPSPFCLLDEIDAPLDDANIGRFVEMLQGMQEHTQFILITHNRKTMEIANRLYGVTMEEPGVSKLISVQLN